MSSPRFDALSWLHDDPRVTDLPMQALGLWVKTLSWMGKGRTSVIRMRDVLAIGGSQAQVERLCEVGAWQRVDVGRFHVSRFGQVESAGGNGSLEGSPLLVRRGFAGRRAG